MGASSKVWMKEQWVFSGSQVWMKEQWELSGSQVLQWLVAFLLQMTVVVFLGREWHAVQRVMGMQPLLLFQRQALQLS